MNSVILIGDEKLSLSKLEEVEFTGYLSRNRLENSIALEFIEGRIYFDCIKDSLIEFEQEELIRIPIDNPQFISLAYSSKDILKKVLLKIGMRFDLMIDDDMGNIIKLKDFVEQL